MVDLAEATRPADIPHPRDRNATAARILRAAAELLAEGGFQNFGVNAVARRAACDKQLIYRYFGGMDGLIEAIGRDLAGWVEERMPDRGGALLLTYGDLVERFLLLLLEALRGDPLMKRILAWEVSENSPQVRMLGEARARSLTQWLDRVRGGMAPPKGIDTTAINAVLIGAVHHLVLSGEVQGRSGTLSLKTSKDWDKAALAVRRLVRGVYP